MAYNNDNEASGAPPYARFGGGHTFTAHRAFIWDTGSNVGIPIAPPSALYSGVASADGKGGFLALPGAVVKIEVVIPAAQSITAGTTYTINTSGQMTNAAGSAFRALESLSNPGGSPLTQVVKAEVWKPKG